MAEPSETPAARSTVDFLRDKIPPWLVQATPEQRDRLRAVGPQPLPWPTAPALAVQRLQAAYSRLRTNEQRLAPILAQLPSPQAFAEPLLVAALKERFGLDLDVHNCYLFNARHVDPGTSFLKASMQDPVVQMHTALKAATQTLLACALQNFEARETEPGGMDAGPGKPSALFSGYPIQGVAVDAVQLAIAPTEFAALCRELDLGGQYQALIEAQLLPADEPGQGAGVGQANRAALFRLLEHSAFEVQVHLAYLNGEIDEPLREMALEVARGRPATLDGVAVNCMFLTLWDVELTGVVAIGKKRDTDRVQPLLVYMPQDPVAPLKCYGSTAEFHNALRDRLLQPGYLAYFQQLIPARQRNRLLARLNEVLYPKVWNASAGYYEQRADAGARLHLRDGQQLGSFLSGLFQQKTAALRDDARFHAVSSAQADQKSVMDKLEYFLGVAFTVANLAAFVVPGLGEVMLLVTAGQMLHETYEGIVDLARGEREQAWACLMDVLENVALMAALGSTGPAGVAAVKLPEVLGQMREVRLPDGSSRLWKPNLTPFAYDVVLPAGLQPNAAGLYEFQGRLWLARDGQLFAVKAPSASAGYRLEHPLRSNAYEPQLRHNGVGGWLHELDQPLDWQGLTLFRRLGRLGVELSDGDAARAMQVSNTHEATLRRVLAESEPPPALLVDTVQRFEIDQTLTQFVARMRASEATADPQLQLQLLQDLPGWPQDRHVLPLGGDVLVEALGMLDEPAIKMLLGEEPGIGRLALDLRLRQLRSTLADVAQARRGELFAARYAQTQAPRSAEAAVLQRDFRGLADAVVEELLANASAPELNQLRGEQRVPKRLAEEARIFQQQLRLNRAYEGLFLQTPASPDTAKLILHSLERLPGWNAELRIEVREANFSGALLDSVGPPQASTRKVLVWDGEGYMARDAQDLHLHGRDNLYAALMHALPDQERAALGLAHVGQGDELQQLLQAQPLLARRTLMELLHMPARLPGSRSPMRLADGRIGYPLSGRGSMSGFIPKENLLDKIRLIEFDDVFPEDMFKQLGATLDHVQINARLDQLLDEQQQLRTCFRQWSEAAVTDGLYLPGRADSREALVEALWKHWRATCLPEIGRLPGVLTVRGFYVNDFPRTLPTFLAERTTTLRIHEAHPLFPLQDLLGLEVTPTLEPILRQFPRLTALEVNRSPLFMNIPRSAADLLPELRSLSLAGLGAYLAFPDMNALRRMPNLRWLDLSGNYLLGSSMDFSGLRLEYLGLNQLNLREWPATLSAEVMASIGEVSLNNNSLGWLPEFMVRVGHDGGTRTRVRLVGNQLSREILTRIAVSEWSGSRYSYMFDIPAGARPHLEALARERAELIQVLDNWSQASTSTTPARPARARTAEILRQFWHEHALAQGSPTLVLDEAAIQDFPERLPATFLSRVENLEVALTAANRASFSAVLPRFQQVTELRLIGGQGIGLNSLPEAIVNLPTLWVLDLRNLGQLVDQAAMEYFGRLPAITRLVLNGNALGPISDASALARGTLQFLEMRNVGLQAWPAWLDQLVPDAIDTLLLTDNQIIELPQHLLDNPASRDHHVHIDLRRNPLSRASMTDAHLSSGYNRSYSFEMDLPEDIRGLRHYRRDSDSEASSPETMDHHSDSDDGEAFSGYDWIVGSEAQVAQRTALWQRLEAGGDAADLLALIARLRLTAEYRTRDARADLVERVWAVLTVAEQDPALRLTLNGMAQEPMEQFRQMDTCPDGLRLEFNQMEVQMFVRQSLLEISEQQRGPSLYRLTRRLYRLDELDSIARERSGARDEAEVRLAYRLNLAQVLELPLAPQRMLFEGVADVAPDELAQALERVRQGEGGPAFMNYASQRDFWVAYLRETYDGRFRVLEERFRSQVLALVDQYPTDTAAQASARVAELESKYRADQLFLLRQLTVEEGQAV